MNVFEFRNLLIEDYSSYISSFININDPIIKAQVEKDFSQGVLWKEPLVQLNPSFQKGKFIYELVEEGVLHPECRRIFQSKDENGSVITQLRTHHHQEVAIRAASTDKNYILTTGTGSGKSLAYIIPIVNKVLNEVSGKGIQAIIVYPMNALANSQNNELAKFLKYGYSEGKEPVTFGRYTGQESREEREQLQQNPPDILLTNYMMLELILTRVDERSLLQSAQGLKYLVLDELHTYRGRQGADVAFLVRRLRDTVRSPRMQCVGTSATLAGSGNYYDQQIEIAHVASKIFGDNVEPDNVIGETLERTTDNVDTSSHSFLSELKECVQDTQFGSKYEDFIRNPLAIWVENKFGVIYSESSGLLMRATPISIYGENGAAHQLKDLTGEDIDKCANAIQKCFLAGHGCVNTETGFPVFAFKLHQFVSRGDTVYASIEDEKERHITLNGQWYVPNDREKILLPLVFCRECGQEYYCVRRKYDHQRSTFSYEPRELNDRLNEDNNEAGYLYFNSESPWPTDKQTVISRIPDIWVEETNGTSKVKPGRSKYLPQVENISKEGIQCPSEEGLPFAYFASPFRFCLRCGVTYGSWQHSDFGKVSTLGSEGRSTATTIMGLSAIRLLNKEENLAQKARKLLSFTDNRQDASLQSGHFNDFVEVGILRAATYKAVEKASDEGLTHDELCQKVFEALNMGLAHYAQNPTVRYRQLEDTNKTFRDVLGYRIYRDLRRGWRIVAPNLEQCGLLEIEYLSLKELCHENSDWVNLHPALVSASPEVRYHIAKTLLGYMRRELAIQVEYLNHDYQDRLVQRTNQWLKEPWSIDENEVLEKSTVVYPCARPKNKVPDSVFISPRGGFGHFLGAPSSLPEYDNHLNSDDKQTIIEELLKTLQMAGIVSKCPEQDMGEKTVSGYQIQAGSMLWRAGDGQRVFHDPISVPNQSSIKSQPNTFFVDYYKNAALKLIGVYSKEHTAQVQNNIRQEREEAFKSAELPILFCSPTMELGVDISELNVVNMRNIPPTPANYAQRSGRAGRSGQPAFVYSYCSLGSPHDQYFFKRPELMVSGAVTPPRLDLTNQDLIRSHIHAIWLEELRQSLGNTLCDILDLSGEHLALNLKEDVEHSINNPNALHKAKERAKRILNNIEDELAQADWYSETWIDEVFNVIRQEFNKACNRWRSLYKSAHLQAKEQQKIILDATRSETEKKIAERLRREAESQLKLLTDSRSTYVSDFYSYRYFASEGFLPGYSFPRLPLSAFIPARKHKIGQDEFLSRPRFLAISEFGPRAVVYHEGSQYQINRVILPVSEEGIVVSYMKQCQHCGFIHPESDTSNIDKCERCDEELVHVYRNLFRMENVSTRRRQRINSDEEERLRLGYEIKTGFRFAFNNGHAICKEAIAYDSDTNPIGKLYYGHTATLYRFNLGWSRRKNKNQCGYTLDIERGYWAKNEQMPEDSDDPMGPKTKIVIPYVEDRRNCLLFEPIETLTTEQIASLQSALKNAIQAEFQLEDNELAVEPLPDIDNFKQILIYESAEGGAGVLRRILEDSKVLSKVAQKALEICHFNPDTYEDQGRAGGAKEDCEAACYSCLMSYGNQRTHKFLDRKCIKDILVDLKNATIHISPTKKSRGEHLSKLLSLCESTLEKKWLDFVEKKRLNLPTHAQKRIQICMTKPDFFYDNHSLAVYIDGPYHDFPERHQRDKDVDKKMRATGYSVLRFGHTDNWEDLVRKYPNVFGSLE